MRSLVFDTETTGLPDKRKGAQLSSQPYIVQLAACLFDEQRPVGHLSFVIVPIDKDGKRVPVPIEASNVHGITDDVIDRVGVSLKVAVATFNNLVKRTDRLIAHNIDFDDLLVRAAYSRCAAPQEEYWNVPKICTKASTEDICKLPPTARMKQYGMGNKWKSPTLLEAHQHLLGEGFDGAHDAMVDVLACARVAFKVEELGHQLVTLNLHPLN